MRGAFSDEVVLAFGPMRTKTTAGGIGGDRHRSLLAWYRRHRRDLPWRRTRDPYAILVSELMLQQTRVAVVEDRWRRFLERFPDVEALAGASADDVLALWSGLGYYRRARQLHAAARAIRDRHGGRVPAEAARLRELPGVGAYTAAAVASIAFDRPEPPVDGNAARVLARWFRLRGDARSGPAARRLARRAAELVPRDGGAGEWNQALMELGALVCLPRRPRCGACPVASSCGAAAEGRPERYPGPGRATRPVRESVVRAALERNGRWLLRRNGAGETPEGLFEFPALPCPSGRATPAAVARLVERRWGWRVEDCRELGTVRHQILARSILVRVFAARVVAGPAMPPRSAGTFRRVALSRLSELPVSGATLKIARLLARR